MTADATSIAAPAIGSASLGAPPFGAAVVSSLATVEQVAPPTARRRDLTPSAAFSEEVRDSVRLLAGCLGAAGAAAVFLHFVTVWAG